MSTRVQESWFLNLFCSPLSLPPSPSSSCSSSFFFPLLCSLSPPASLSPSHSLSPLTLSLPPLLVSVSFTAVLRERVQEPRRPAFSVGCSQGHVTELWLPVYLRQTPRDHPPAGRAPTSLWSGWGGWQGEEWGIGEWRGWDGRTFFFFFCLSFNKISNPIISLIRVYQFPA